MFKESAGIKEKKELSFAQVRADFERLIEKLQKLKMRDTYFFADVAFEQFKNESDRIIH